MINVGKDLSINRPDKPGIQHFDSVEKAYNYLEELENEPIDNLIQTPITIHHVPSMREWLKKGVRLLPNVTDEDKMLRVIIVSRIMGASPKKILRHFRIAVTDKSIAMIKAQELKAFRKIKDLLAKSKHEGMLLLPDSVKYNNKLKEVL